MTSRTSVEIVLSSDADTWERDAPPGFPEGRSLPGPVSRATAAPPSAEDRVGKRQPGSAETTSGDGTGRRAVPVSTTPHPPPPAEITRLHEGGGARPSLGVRANERDGTHGAATSAAPTRLALLLTVAETAEVLRTSRKAIYDMAARGKLPGAVHVGRRLLVRRADLLGFLAGRGSSPGGTCR